MYGLQQWKTTLVYTLVINEHNSGAAVAWTDESGFVLIACRWSSQNLASKA